MKVTLLYVLVMYNMNKYFIEYPKHRLYVCYDGTDSYLNLIINHCDNEYVFVQFLYGTCKISKAVRKVLKLGEENNALFLVTCMIMDEFLNESKTGKGGEFKYTILPEKDKDKNIKIKYYQVFTYVQMTIIMIHIWV